MNPPDTATCEHYQHKPATWTEPDETGLIVGVCGCGRYIWQASDRQGMSRAAKRELVLHVAARSTP